mmetsp:Transcript_32778/g.107160  ORF Transcript_32778/g.107160 Transcript_32778/m.107160 type:complete len:243 (+) Transcript_32778:24-752(+)
MRTRNIECIWREGQPSARLIVLQIVSAEFFVFGQTKCIAVNPDGTRPDLEAFRWLVGRSWSNYPAAVLEIHKALRGHQTGVREYELFETYVVPDEPLAGKAFPKVGSRRSKAQRGGERYDVRYSAEPEVAMLPVSMLASDVCPVTNRPRSDGKWIKVGECRPIVPVRLSKEDAAMGLLKHMPDGRYHPPNHKSGKGKKRARDTDGQVPSKLQETGPDADEAPQGPSGRGEEKPGDERALPAR